MSRRLAFVGAAAAACSSRGQPTGEVGEPSVEEARRLFAANDLDAVATAFSALTPERKQQWVGFLDAHLAELQSTGQPIEAFCAAISKVGSKTDTGRAPRWHLLVTACSSLGVDLDDLTKRRQRRSDAEHALEDAKAENTKLDTRAQELKRELNSVTMFSGFIIQRLDAHTYEVAMAEMIEDF